MENDIEYVGRLDGDDLLRTASVTWVREAEKASGELLTSGTLMQRAAAAVARVVAEGGSVALPGIGKVACRTRPERMVRNPQTQEMMQKPADKVVKVTIAKALKDSVNA